MVVLWHHLSGDTRCPSLSTTGLTYLGPSIVRVWFIPTEVTKGRQHVVLNLNETMESHCVQAQHGKGGWLCWAFCGWGWLLTPLYRIWHKGQQFLQKFPPPFTGLRPQTSRYATKHKMFSSYLHNAILLRLIQQALFPASSCAPKQELLLTFCAWDLALSPMFK